MSLVFASLDRNCKFIHQCKGGEEKAKIKKTETFNIGQDVSSNVCPLRARGLTWARWASSGRGGGTRQHRRPRGAL